MADQSKRDYYERRLGALKTERSTFEPQYRNIARHISPRRGRFHRNERNRGGQHWWNQIINSQATWALRVGVSGMYAGNMNPTVPWLMLETDDPDIAEYDPARQWFFIVQEQMRRIFNASNLYAMIPVLLREQLLFGTGCMSDVDDDETLSRYYTHTVGGYYLDQNDRYEVDTVYREFDRTVKQIVQQFSSGGQVSKNISAAVRSQWDNGNYDVLYPVRHCVEPNDAYVLGSRRPTEKAWRSVYYEAGQGDRNVVLSDKGFDEFPFYCPRWDVTEDDVYATDCPGMSSLGDVRQLQFQEKRKAQALDLMVAPTLHGPAALANQRVQALPGTGIFYDAPGQNNRLETLFESRPNLEDMGKDLAEVINRINRDFYVDLFLAISAMEGVQPRNYLELSQRNQERLLQLGPTLRRQDQEVMTPLVYRTFSKMVRAGLVPPAPPVLQNRPLKPRFVSPMALAQQAIETGNIDRLLGFIGAAAQFKPDVVDKANLEQMVDRYGAYIGSPPDLIRSDEEVAAMRQQRAQQEQMLAQLEMGQQAANIAKMAGDTKLDDDNLASRAVEQMGGGRAGGS